MAQMVAYPLGQRSEEFVEELGKLKIDFYPPNELFREKGVFTYEGSFGIACLGQIIEDNEVGAYIVVYNQKEDVLKKERSRLIRLAREFDPSKSRATADVA